MSKKHYEAVRGGYIIVFQERAPYNGKFPQSDWRGWRKFSVWPISFERHAQAQAHLESIQHLFANMAGRRKLSASVWRRNSFKSAWRR